MLYPMLDPAIRLMSRLDYRQKFMLVSGVFLFPIVLLLIFSWQALIADVDFAKSERQGVAIIQYASDTLYRSLLPAHQPPAAPAPRLANAAKTLGADHEWAALIAAADPAARSDAAVSLIAKVNDSSNLILDPELASYFVGDAIIGKLGSAMTGLAALPTASATTPATRLQALTQGQAVAASLADLRTEIDKAARAEPAALKPVMEPLKHFNDAALIALNEYQRTVEKPLQDGQDIGPLANLADAVNGALAHGATLSAQGLATVDALLETRIHARLGRLALVICVSLLALLIAVWLQAGFFLSTERNLSLLTSSFANISAGHFEPPPPLQGHDEMAALNRPIRQMVQTLNDFSLAQLNMAAAHDAGNISHLMDEKRFDGGWREMAARINQLILSHTEIEMKMVALTSLYSQGEYSITIDKMSGLKAMISDEIERVRESMIEASQVAEFTLKLKQALDQVRTPVLISDTGDQVIYQNEAASHALQLGQSARALPAILSDGGWHLWQAGKASQGQVTLHQRRFTVTVSPILNGEGALVGHVSEWLDQTEALAMADEISHTVSRAAAGLFDQRISLDGKTGFFADLGRQINMLLDQTQQSLHAFSASLARLAEGDLNHSLPDDFQGIFGELASSTNATIAQLKQSIHAIRDASSEVAKASQQLAGNATSLLNRTRNQASHTERTAASAQQINSQVRQNADSATAAAQLVSATSSEAQASRQAMASVQQAMDKLSQSSSRIADITSMIDGIAFQTNILALNAAVEAARAGDAGRGFAVVASEVRSLAQKSAVAAREIRGLVEESVGDIHDGHQRVEQSVVLNRNMLHQVEQLATVINE
ncbi:methyl-accepting chemotaxis protein, partial [Chitinimonas sp.]|uniref:methyl-accepting chemotaxis protein n=1 Tax=Chitinimonas sp. TaxID=1934313 RepID=UPI0035B34BD2